MHKGFVSFIYYLKEYEFIFNYKKLEARDFKIS